MKWAAPNLLPGKNVAEYTVEGEKFDLSQNLVKRHFGGLLQGGNGL
jgi:hypothetical protein